MFRLPNVTGVLSTLAFTIAVALLALGTPIVRADSLSDEIQDFHKLMHDHPRIAGQVERNPNLVNDPGFVNSHDDLRQFLQDHPRVRRELSHNPGRIVNGSYVGDDRRHEDERRRYDDRRHDEDRRFDWRERR